MKHKLTKFMQEFFKEEKVRKKFSTLDVDHGIDTQEEYHRRTNEQEAYTNLLSSLIAA